MDDSVYKLVSIHTNDKYFMDYYYACICATVSEVSKSKCKKPIERKIPSGYHLYRAKIFMTQGWYYSEPEIYDIDDGTYEFFDTVGYDEDDIDEDDYPIIKETRYKYDLDDPNTIENFVKLITPEVIEKYILTCNIPYVVVD